MAKVCPTCGTTYDDKNVFCPNDGSTLRAESGGDEGDLVGTVIADRYLVTDKLGEGGMGRVFLARHVRLPQQAAIKVLHPSMVHDTASLARFNAEAANACRINNQHVATVYDFGETADGLVYLAMEYVSGNPLSKLLETGGPMEPRRVGTLISQVAEGLDAAHRLGIVHRDLKPDNIIVERDQDGNECAKVVDFGIAKAVSEGQKGVTQTGFVVGTAEYMSPEQITGGNIDRRTDVYALGLVAYILLTGELPFSGTTREEAMVMRLTSPPKPLAEVRPEINWPAELQGVIDKALARKVDERWGSTGAFAKALTEAVDAWERAVTQPAAPVDVAPPVTATGVMTSGSGTTPNVVQATTSGVTQGATPERTAPPVVTTQPAKRGASMAVMAGGTVVVLGIAAFAAVKVLGRSNDGSAANRHPDSVAVAANPTGSTAAAAARETTAVVPPPDTKGKTSSIVSNTANSKKGPGATDRSGPTERTPTGTSKSGGDASNDAQISAMLDDLRDQLGPNASEAAAQKALSALTGILPLIHNKTDAMRAQLLRVDAYGLLGQSEQACSVLKSVRDRPATATQQAQIATYNNSLKCW